MKSIIRKSDGIYLAIATVVMVWCIWTTLHSKTKIDNRQVAYDILPSTSSQDHSPLPGVKGWIDMKVAPVSMRLQGDFGNGPMDYYFANNCVSNVTIWSDCQSQFTIGTNRYRVVDSEFVKVHQIMEKLNKWSPYNVSMIAFAGVGIVLLVLGLGLKIKLDFASKLTSPTLPDQHINKVHDDVTDDGWIDVIPCLLPWDSNKPSLFPPDEELIRIEKATGCYAISVCKSELRSDETLESIVDGIDSCRLSAIFWKWNHNNWFATKGNSPPAGGPYIGRHGSHTIPVTIYSDGKPVGSTNWPVVERAEDNKTTTNWLDLVDTNLPPSLACQMVVDGNFGRDTRVRFIGNLITNITLQADYTNPLFIGTNEFVLQNGMPVLIRRK